MPVAGSITGVPVTPISGWMSPEPSPTKCAGDAGNRGLAGGCAVRRIDQAHHPELRARGRVRVEREQTVVLGRHEHDVVLRAADGHVRDPERLRVDRAVDRARGEFPERARHIGGGERVLLAVHAVARQVVVIGVHAGEIRDRHARGRALRRVRDAGRHDVVHARVPAVYRPAELMVPTVLLPPRCRRRSRWQRPLPAPWR